MVDGEIDYSGYTLSELNEALSTIDASQFPENYSNLIAARDRLVRAMETRSEEGNWAKSTLDLSKFSTLIGVLGSLALILWSYNIYSRPDYCPHGDRKFSRLIGSLCDSLGHETVGAIFGMLGLLAFVYWFHQAIRQVLNDAAV